MAFQTLIEGEKGKLVICKNYVTVDLFEFLNRLPFNIEPEIFIFGRTMRQRRDVLFYSNESEGYKYSGQIMRSVPFSGQEGEFLLALMQRVNQSLGTNFNGILINRYQDGTKTIGAHSDDEKGLDANNSSVASISFGAARTFRIRDKHTKEIVVDVQTESGILILMSGNFQRSYTHEISQQKTIHNSRISLTFRSHKE
ncbi:MAG: alkylated DNA repair protein [Solivirus sp.]|uniref:Alkylated DNA repair protein n=1 Tax=Solivirus sp. TaxID=2487772 RepID=A0A3G5AFX4_9VIRU|nr:MAG: alkylated DNA repair protein [Solivirus sp.]